MPLIPQNEAYHLVDKITPLIVSGNYDEVIAIFRDTAKKAFEGESDPEMIMTVANDFIAKAQYAPIKGVPAFIAMKGLLVLGQAISATLSGEKKEKLDFILTCGAAIWPTGFFSKPEPAKLIELLSSLLPEESRPKRRLG